MNRRPIDIGLAIRRLRIVNFIAAAILIGMAFRFIASLSS